MNQKYLPSLICGIVLIGIFLFAIKKRYYIQNPAVFYSMVFILITAIGVSGLRSDFGITQSLASRYRIYSNVFLILSYIFWTETFLFEKSKRVQQTALAGVILVSFVFFCGSNIAGFRFLQGRKLATEQALAEWQNPSLASSPGDPQDQGDSAVRRQIANGMYKPNSEVLLESMRLGVYQPPVQTPGSK